jgi:hypothetical protein
MAYRLDFFLANISLASTCDLCFQVIPVREIPLYIYIAYKGIYNARCLGEMFRLINRFLVKHWCLYRLGRCLTKHLSYTNKHQCLPKCLVYFGKHPL